MQFMLQFKNELSLAVNIHFSEIRSHGGNWKGKDITSLTTFKLRLFYFIHFNLLFAACP